VDVWKVLVVRSWPIVLQNSSLRYERAIIESNRVIFRIDVLRACACP
jgi:hypothetical protein